MSKRPIIIIKKKGGHGGHHGGAWKVAYADFVTAMMSLFIVLWLMNSTPQIKKAVAGYFNDPRGRAEKTGTDNLGAGSNISVDEANVEKLKDAIQKAIMKQADLSKLAKNIEITITNEGLRVELIEDKGGTFFESGSAKLSESGTKLLDVIAGQLKPLPNHLMLEGHTDAQPYSADNAYTNWELSSDRANAARRVLQEQGIADERISQVRGYADQMLRVKSDPMDPSNRRISLIVQWVEAAPGVVRAVAAGPKGVKLDGEQAATAVPGGVASKVEAAPVGAGGSGAAKPRPGTPAASGTGGTPAVPGTPVASAKLEASVKSIAPAAKSGVAVAKPAAVAKPTMMERVRQMLPGSKKQG
jgi:chemotaxis protein MotB